LFLLCSKSLEAALAHGAELVEGAALERGIKGTPVPIFQGGRQVGERRVFNERLTMFLLQHRKPGKYGHAKSGDTSAEDLARAASVREETVARHSEWVEKRDIAAIAFRRHVLAQRRAALLDARIELLARSRRLWAQGYCWRACRTLTISTACAVTR